MNFVRLIFFIQDSQNLRFNFLFYIPYQSFGIKLKEQNLSSKIYHSVSFKSFSFLLCQKRIEIKFLSAKPVAVSAALHPQYVCLSPPATVIHQLLCHCETSCLFNCCLTNSQESWTSLNISLNYIFYGIKVSLITDEEK